MIKVLVLSNYILSQYDKNARREMISVESSSKGCSETLFSTNLTQERSKPKKKVLKVTIKTAVPKCVSYIFMYFFLSDIYAMI